jgi:glycerol-3-phosphate O-acyltransferase
MPSAPIGPGCAGHSHWPTFDTPHLPLLGYVRRRNLPAAGELRLDRAGVIRQVLQALVSMGVVTRYDKGTDPVYQVAENQQLVAAFYRNNIIHFLINRAVTELVLQAAAEEHYGDPAADGWQEALRLRDLLKFEFFFSGKPAYRHEIRSELALIDLSGGLSHPSVTSASVV